MNQFCAEVSRIHAAVCMPACELHLLDLSVSVSALLTWRSELQQAEQLAALLRRFDLRSHVNVIPVRLGTFVSC